MTLTIDDAHDLLIVVAERHKDPDGDWAHAMTADWVAEMGERRVPEHNALVLLNKLMDDISEFRDRTGANPNEHEPMDRETLENRQPV
jgi:hypothetical protein